MNNAMDRERQNYSRPMQSFHAIPTMYNGRQYRSRLEARWAAFFDLVGWQYEYEPFDLDGWIPDFALLVPGDPILTEVKPATHFPQAVADEIDRADQTHEALILGTCPFFPRGDLGFEEAPVLGWLREVVGWDDESGLDWGAAVMGRWTGSESTAKNPSRLIGFCHEIQSFRDRITGSYDGGCYGDSTLIPGEVKAMWAAAANLTQWNPPTQRRRFKGGFRLEPEPPIRGINIPSLDEAMGRNESSP